MRTTLVIADDPAFVELLAEWLGPAGWRVVNQQGDTRHVNPDLLIVDVPFPRKRGLETIRAAVAPCPGVVVLAVSAEFLPGMVPRGSVARSLGVQAVLPKPVTRDELVAALSQLVND